MAAAKPTAKITGQQVTGQQVTGKDAASTEAVKQITYLAAALKAPRITEAAARHADQARDAGWTHEDYLAAVLERTSVRSQRLRRPAADLRRRVRCGQDAGGLRLRRSTRGPSADRCTRIRWAS